MPVAKLAREVKGTRGRRPDRPDKTKVPQSQAEDPLLQPPQLTSGRSPEDRPDRIVNRCPRRDLLLAVGPRGGGR